MSSPIHINSGRKEFPCDVPCFVSSKRNGGVIRDVRIDELESTMAFSMEGAAYDLLYASQQWRWTDNIMYATFDRSFTSFGSSLEDVAGSNIRGPTHRL